MAPAEYLSLCGPKLFGDRLLEAGLITRTQLDLALERQQIGTERRQRLGRTLVELGFLADADLIQMLGVHLAIAVAPFTLAEAESRAIRSVPCELARRHRAVPYRIVGRSLLIAVADPLPPSVVEEIEALTGFSVVPYLAREEEIDAALTRHYAGDIRPASHAGPPSTQESSKLAQENVRLREELERLRQDTAALLDTLINAARELLDRHNALHRG